MGCGSPTYRRLVEGVARLLIRRLRRRRTRIPGTVGHSGDSAGPFRGHSTQLIAKPWADWYFPGMARLARVVVPGLPHHVTQPGNRRQQTFFGDDDYYAAYIELMAQWCGEEGGEIWSYCLMPNLST